MAAPSGVVALLSFFGCSAMAIVLPIWLPASEPTAAAAWPRKVRRSNLLLCAAFVMPVSFRRSILVRYLATIEIT